MKKKSEKKSDKHKKWKAPKIVILGTTSYSAPSKTIIYAQYGGGGGGSGVHLPTEGGFDGSLIQECI